MDYRYIGYTDHKKLVKGTIEASNAEAAVGTLSGWGYQVLSLKPTQAFLPNWEKLFPSLYQVKPEEVIMFSRQLALLLESGTDIVTSLELLQSQVSNNVFRKVLAEAVTDLRSGSRLSSALGSHPEIFSSIYCRSLRVGEQTGALETSLRQIADHNERELKAKKDVKNALAYPAIVSVVAVIVMFVLVTFVLPAFVGLYSTLGAQLPLPTRILLAVVGASSRYSVHSMVFLIVAALGTAIYTRTSQGRCQWDRLALNLPLIGRINRLQELARCCRSISVLFRSGLPLTEIMNITIEGSGNRVMALALTRVQQAMLQGEGLSQPMSRDELFFPMMVQMVRVGEETGNLDVTLSAIAQSYEAEAGEKTRSLTALIQPVMTLAIGGVVAFITISLLSAMYAVYGQMGT